MSGACYLCNKPEEGNCKYQKLAFTERGQCSEMKWAIYGLIHKAADDVKKRWQDADEGKFDL